jgi:hypothetical protein
MDLIPRLEHEAARLGGVGALGQRHDLPRHPLGDHARELGGRLANRAR